MNHHPWRPDGVPSLGAKPARCCDHSGAVTAECTNHYYTLLAIVAQCSRCTTEQPLEHRLPCTWSDLHVHKVRNDYSNNRFKYASCSYCRQARATRAASCPTRDTRSWTLSAINNRQQWSNELFTTLATSACHCR